MFSASFSRYTLKKGKFNYFQLEFKKKIRKKKYKLIDSLKLTSNKMFQVKNKRK